MSEYEFTISLRIRHPSVEPHTITETLGIEPQHTWKAGDARRSPAGEALAGKQTDVKLCYASIRAKLLEEFVRPAQLGESL